MVGEAWGLGDIEVRTLGAEKCGYLAGYVTKKMTAANDPRLRGRFPEFSRQSRGGSQKGSVGIGAAGIPAMAEVIVRYCNPEELVDVPTALEQSHKPLVLGRYMRRKLRLALGLDEGTPDEVLRQAWYEQVLPLLEMAKANPSTPSLKEAFRSANQSYADTLAFKAETFERGKL